MWREGKKLAQVARIEARGQLFIPKSRTQNEPQAEYDEALLALGLEQVDNDAYDAPLPDQKCYLWPCNLRTFYLWQCLRTQWRIGVAGRTGLDYAAVIAYLRDVACVKPKVLPELFASLQAMECAVLEVVAEAG